MREFLKTRGVGWLRAGGFWTAVLLVLPNCSFDPSGLGPSSNFYAGPFPRNDVVFCDIERVVGRHCSSASERARGIRLADAAVALNEGRTSDVALDDSADALDRCAGQPEAVVFQGGFPEGFPVCVNCAGAIGTVTTPNVTSACQQRCLDFFGPVDAEGNVRPEIPPDPLVVEFCNARSRPSTNFPLDTCFMGACDGGTLRMDFVDPRRDPEPVVWTDLVGVTAAADGSLTRATPTTFDFDAGAASEQRFASGDGFVEFTAAQADQAQALGLTEVSLSCPAPCADTDPSLSDLGFAIVLNFDGRIYLVVRGTILTGPDITGSFGVYTAGERFRVRLRDNGDTTATVTFARTLGTCVPGNACPQTVFFTHTGTPAQYPLRVDASMRDQGAVLSQARVVRIK